MIQENSDNDFISEIQATLIFIFEYIDQTLWTKSLHDESINSNQPRI